MPPRCIVDHRDREVHKIVKSRDYLQSTFTDYLQATFLEVWLLFCRRKPYRYCHIEHHLDNYLDIFSSYY